MKKVTLTFVVSDGVADDVQNELAWGNNGNAACILNENCQESDYDIEDCNELGIAKGDNRREELLRETIVLLSADLYQKVYDSRDDHNYGDSAMEIVSLAEKFEEELNWQDDDDRDYIVELEKFEKKVLDNLKS